MLSEPPATAAVRRPTNRFFGCFGAGSDGASPSISAAMPISTCALSSSIFKKYRYLLRNRGLSVWRGGGMLKPVLCYAPSLRQSRLGLWRAAGGQLPKICIWWRRRARHARVCTAHGPTPEFSQPYRCPQLGTLFPSCGKPLDAKSCSIATTRISLSQLVRLRVRDLRHDEGE